MIIFLDTETTDGTKSCKICQLAFKVDGKAFMTYAKNSVPITFEAMSVHHITNEMVNNAIPLEETPEYRYLLLLNHPDNYIVAHNAAFDIQALSNHGFINHMKIIDTVKVSKLLIDSRWHKLQYLRYSLGLYQQEVEMIQPHDALGDIIVLERLFNYFCTNHQLNVEQIYELSNKKTYVRRMPLGKYKGQLIESVPSDYLKWCLRQIDSLSDDLKESIENALKNRHLITDDSIPEEPVQIENQDS